MDFKDTESEYAYAIRSCDSLEGRRVGMDVQYQRDCAERKCQGKETWFTLSKIAILKYKRYI